MKNITIYSAPTCRYCTMTKNFLQKRGFTYTEIDISVDLQKAQEALEKTGQIGIPIIIINKDGQEEILIGFNQVQLSKALERNDITDLTEEGSSQSSLTENK